MRAVKTFSCALLLFGLIRWASIGLGAATEPQAAIDAWLATRSGGIAVALVRDDVVTFHAAGFHSASDPRPVGPDTLFEIGSVTKVFTAILLADAIERGVLALDDTVGAPFAPSAVTYRQLATHTSGLPRLPVDFGASDPANPYGDQTLKALIGSFARDAANARPSNPAYSNFGFAVLGQAVAAADHDTWGNALKTRVLGPLGLHDTFVSTRDADPKRLPPGHVETRGVALWTFEAYAPAGAMVSSARDLARLVRAVLGTLDTPVNPAIARTLQRVAYDPNANLNSGLAWVLERRGGQHLVGHNGQTGGFHSFVGANPAQKTGVVVLTNAVEDVEPLGYTLLSGEPLQLPHKSASPPAAAALQPLVGDYPITPSFVVTISVEGEQLFFQCTNQPRVRLKRVSENRYALEGDEAEVEFDRVAGTGAATALVLHQSGLAQRARKLAPGEKPAARKEITLQADELRAYVGRYQLTPAVEIIVRQEEDRLFAQLTGQPSTRVFAEGKDRFFYKIVDAQLTFERGAAEQGQIGAVVLHQNGNDLRAPRIP